MVVVLRQSPSFKRRSKGDLCDELLIRHILCFDCLPWHASTLFCNLHPHFTCTPTNNLLAFTVEPIPSLNQGVLSENKQ